MDRHDPAYAEQPRRHGRFLRPQRVVVTYRQQRDVGAVQLADQGQPGERGRVAGVVDPAPVGSRERTRPRRRRRPWARRQCWTSAWSAVMVTSLLRCPAPRRGSSSAPGRSPRRTIQSPSSATATIRGARSRATSNRSPTWPWCPLVTTAASTSGTSRRLRQAQRVAGEPGGRPARCGPRGPRARRSRARERSSAAASAPPRPPLAYRLPPRPQGWTPRRGGCATSHARSGAI
jgi:hypothetical protein